MTATADGGMVGRKLRSAWHKQRRFYHTRGLCLTAMWLAALILLDLLIDWLFELPGYGRMLLLAVNVGTLVYIVYTRWLRHLRRYDPVRLALQVEDRHPELRSLLVSYVQFGGEEQARAVASPALLRALRRQTIEFTTPIDFREIVSFREIQKIFLVSLAVLLLFAATSVQRPEFLRVLFARLADPTSELTYPTSTLITGGTGDLVVQFGRDVTVRATAGGEIPDEGQVLVRPEGADWQELPVPKARPAEFAHEFRGVHQDLEYRFILGDAEGPVWRIRVVPPPRIAQANVSLQYPAHMAPTLGKPGSDLGTLTFKTPVGTNVTWRLTLNRPAGRAEMHIRNAFTESLGQLTDEYASSVLASEARLLAPFWTNRPDFAAPMRRVASVLGQQAAAAQAAELADAAPKGAVHEKLSEAGSLIQEALDRFLRADAEAAASLRGKALQALSAAAEAAGRRVLELDDGGRVAVADWPGVDESFRYRFFWRDAEHGFEFLDTVDYSVEVTPDAPPTVEVTDPPAEVALMQKVQPVSFRANDDYALRSARIVYWLDEGEQSTSTGDEPEVPAARRSRPVEGFPRVAEVEWPLAEIEDIAEGKVLNYYVEVTDFRGSGRPGRTGRSRTQRITLVDRETYALWVSEQLDRQVTPRIRKVRSDEQKASQALEALRLGGAAKPEGDSDDRD